MKKAGKPSRQLLDHINSNQHPKSPKSPENNEASINNDSYSHALIYLKNPESDVSTLPRVSKDSAYANALSYLNSEASKAPSFKNAKVKKKQPSAQLIASVKRRQVYYQNPTEETIDRESKPNITQSEYFDSPGKCR